MKRSLELCIKLLLQQLNYDKTTPKIKEDKRTPKHDLRILAEYQIIATNTQGKAKFFVRTNASIIRYKLRTLTKYNMHHLKPYLRER